MPTTKRYKSPRAAIEMVKRFFAHTTDDSISLEDVFRMWGRDAEKVKQNKAWLSNKLTQLKYHDLIIPVYSYKNGRRRLEKIQLTLEGKRVLGRIGENIDNANGDSIVKANSNSVSFTNIMQRVAELRKENPDYEITFFVKLKGG